jgi:hypothetical protein
MRNGWERDASRLSRSGRHPDPERQALPSTRSLHEMEGTTVPSAGETGSAHQHEVTGTGDPAVHHVVGVPGTADRERRSTGDGRYNDQPSIPLPVHVRGDADRVRDIVRDAHLVRNPGSEAPEASTVQAHAVSELATELGEQGEVVRRKRDVEAVDLLTDRPEGLPERPERARVELSAEIAEEGRRDGGGHARVADASARA